MCYAATSDYQKSIDPLKEPFKEPVIQITPAVLGGQATREAPTPQGLSSLPEPQYNPNLLGGSRDLVSKVISTLSGVSGDLVSKVISTLIGVISNYKYSYLSYNPSY